MTSLLDSWAKGLQSLVGVRMDEMCAQRSLPELGSKRFLRAGTMVSPTQLPHL